MFTVVGMKPSLMLTLFSNESTLIMYTESGYLLSKVRFRSEFLAAVGTTKMLEVLQNRDYCCLL